MLVFATSTFPTLYIHNGVKTFFYHCILLSKLIWFQHDSFLNVDGYCLCYRALGPGFSTWNKLPTTLSKVSSVTILRVHESGVVTGVRHIAEWHTRRDIKALTQLESLVVTLSLGVFLLYFMWLREPNDIDEYLNQPIWKRLPDIDPEKAEQMMEVDKYLGLQVRFASSVLTLSPAVW